MLIIHAAPDHDISRFIQLVRESSCDFIINNFHEWLNNPEHTPEGFIYIKVAPELVHKNMHKVGKTITLEQIKDLIKADEHYFITKSTMPQELHAIPVLILNGTINFEDDFSQFYTHLFAIKKFFKEIKDAQAKANGTYVPPQKKHRGCKC